MARLMGREVEKIKLFLIGEDWLRHTRISVIEIGYGVLYENGHDLTVQYGSSVGEV